MMKYRADFDENMPDIEEVKKLEKWAKKASGNWKYVC